jgi:hypothetical protein
VSEGRRGRRRTRPRPRCETTAKATPSRLPTQFWHTSTRQSSARHHPSWPRLFRLQHLSGLCLRVVNCTHGVRIENRLCSGHDARLHQSSCRPDQPWTARPYLPPSCKDSQIYTSRGRPYDELSRIRHCCGVENAGLLLVSGPLVGSDGSPAVGRRTSTPDRMVRCGSGRCFCRGSRQCTIAADHQRHP